MQAEDWTLRGVSSGLWVAVLVVESVSCLGGQTIQTVQPMAKDASNLTCYDSVTSGAWRISASAT